ncbi:hypothetical protein BDV93DRAFT_611701 [Ceratobasidium sp. AG-I]|nr:hypothetical protein BDV93DRAFT_611701 [Ceratobasidium sp. AG-I]
MYEAPAGVLAYGVLCLRTLALVLQVGMLETINPNILNQYDTIPVPHYGKTGPIGAFMRQLLVASNGLLLHNREFLQDFRWYKQDGRLACLSVVGGFTSADVNFLLKSIDQSVVPCQIVMGSMRINVFATILFLMWQHVLFLEGKVDVCSSVLNLIFRYFPFSLRAEYDIFRFMNTWLGQRVADLGRFPQFIPANLYDLRTAIGSLEDKLRKPYEEEPLEVEDVAMLTGFLSEGLTTDAVDSVAPLLRAIFMRCWVEIEGLRKEPENRGNIMHLCGRGLLVVTPKLLREDFISDLLRSLPGLDFMGLLGRVMLLGLCPFEGKVTQDDEEALATFIQGVDVFFSTLAHSFHLLLCATFQGSYRNWIVTPKQLNHCVTLTNHTDVYLARWQNCWRCWSEVASVLGYQELPLHCKYPRCIKNFGILECARCQTAIYCSRNCQSAHWSMAGSEAHRLGCTALASAE